MIIRVEVRKQVNLKESYLCEPREDYVLGDTKKVFRNIKDSLFTILFRDIKNVRRLYSILADDNDKYADEDFKILTLENAFVPSVYNDLGFLVGEKLIVLVEEQSSFNPNMAIRYLLYIAETYQNYIIENEINLYGSKKFFIPEPKFYLIYTGNRNFEEMTLKLSDSFGGGEESSLELVVDILTEEAVRDSIIEEYIRFCELYDNNVKISESKLEALKKTIHHCIEQNILREFLQTREREVEEMSMLFYTQEQLMDIALKEKFKEGMKEGIEQGIEQGIERGIKQGIKQGAREEKQSIAESMKNLGYTAEEIERITGLAL